MSETTGGAPDFDPELDQEQVLAAVLRGNLALMTGDDEQVSARLGEAAVALADETEVVRVDASQVHTASGIANALSRALELSTEELLDELIRRGETLPLALVIDNGECLGNQALRLLNHLLAKARGGLGVVIGGEPELGGLLSQAGLVPACAIEVEHQTEEPDAPAAVPAGWTTRLPWKHLAAVVGLLILVVLFWSAGEPEPGETSAQLALPPPQQVSPEASSNPDEEPARSSEPDRNAPREAPEAAPRPQAAPEDEAAGPKAGSADTGESREPNPADARPPGDAAAEPEGLDAELAYRGEDWLLTRSPQQWMLQLALATNEKRARALLDRLGPRRGAYYRARRNGEVVYIVLAGPFGSRGQALGARSSLPDYFRERGPFPRRLRSIAEEIRELSGAGN